MANGDAADKSSETRAPERTDAAEDRARSEALEDRGLLSEREKQYRADLKDGKQRSGEPLEGSIDVDSDGNYIFYSNDGVTEIQRPDGTYRREYPNGAYFERNSDNRVTEVHFANGTSQCWSAYSAPAVDACSLDVGKSLILQPIHSMCRPHARRFAGVNDSG